ncbi:MAG: exonuclease V [Candidatus Marsarchaeota archaeon]|nr:exonuclease V [Candidatus Marsarchaeota archaeon]
MGRVSALERLRKTSISVKDIASQLWCEKQMELYLMQPYSTPAMAKGAAVHATIQEQVFVELPLEPVTWWDRLYKWAYENYNGIMNIGREGYCREVHIYGSINGYRISGQVDELRLSDGRIMVVEDKTINGNGSRNGVGRRIDSDKMQLNIYHKLLEDMKMRRYTYENFARSYGIEDKKLSADFEKGVRSLGVRDEFVGLGPMYRKMFDAVAQMPVLSDAVRLKYLDRDTKNVITEMDMQYDRKGLEAYLPDAMKYWSGNRDARPVSEENKSRCMSCRFFGKQCTVWWNR